MCVDDTCGLFCFFKQKTAYEMRISDWSSDVCSSDLGQGLHPADQRVGTILQAGGAVAQLDEQGVEQGETLRIAVQDCPFRQFDKGEIGRASCRERVCQYV